MLYEVSAFLMAYYSQSSENVYEQQNCPESRCIGRIGDALAEKGLPR